MARKRKKTTHRRRRSRMSGTGDIISQLLPVAVGAIGGRMVNNLLVSTVKLSPMIAGVGTVAIGALVPKFIKGPFGAGIGAGIVAAGAISTATGLGIVSGAPGNFTVVMPRRNTGRVAGAGLTNLKSVAGAGLTNLKSVAGFQPQYGRLHGYSGYGGYSLNSRLNGMGE